MKPSENEIKFAKLRGKIQDTVCTCFSTAELCLGLDCVGGAGNLDSVVGTLQCDTISGQILTQVRTYRNKESGSEKKIEVAIGHTGNWQAIVTVTSTDSQPEQVIFDDDASIQALLTLLVSKLRELT